MDNCTVFSSLSTLVFSLDFRSPCSLRFHSVPMRDAITNPKYWVFLPVDTESTKVCSSPFGTENIISGIAHKLLTLTIITWSSDSCHHDHLHSTQHCFHDKTLRYIIIIIMIIIALPMHLLLLLYFYPFFSSSSSSSLLFCLLFISMRCLLCCVSSKNFPLFFYLCKILTRQCCAHF